MIPPLARHADVTRRTALTGVAATIAGCAGARASRGDTASPTPATTSSPQNGTPPVAAPLPLPPYDPPAGEALPAFKRTAGRFVQALTTYEPGDGPRPAAASLTAFTGSLGELTAAVATLRTAGRRSRGDVEFVQYGGLAPVSEQATHGIALVVVRQVLEAPDGGTQMVRRTLAVRLRRRAGTWGVESIESVGGSAVRRLPNLGPAARRVLDNERITLTDSARWDIFSGRISAPLLAVLSRLADVAPLEVTVLKTGHPRLVVDGRRPEPVSSHFRGRAVDIFALDGVPVTQAAPASLRRMIDVVNGLSAVQQLGVPPGYDLDGRRPRIFSNLVHSDHLHVAVGSAGARVGER